jgi:broad specificity phosphatase PhoE
MTTGHGRYCGSTDVPLTQEGFGLLLSTDARLRELHFGEWEGVSVDELMVNQPEALRLFWKDPGRNAPTGAERAS